MVTSCAAYGCTARCSSKHPGIKFHRFPRNARLKKAWTLAVRREGPTKGSIWEPGEYSRLCSRHFLPQDYEIRRDDKSKLREDAIPSIFSFNKKNSISFYKNKNSKNKFSFPKDPLLQKQWCLAVRRKDFQPTKHSRICSQHFESGYFSNNFGFKTLKKDAVPTILKYNSLQKTKKLKTTKSSSRSSSEPVSLIETEDSITQPHTNSPLVIKLHPRSSTEINSTLFSNEEETQPIENFILPTEVNNEDFLATYTPSVANRTPGKDINLTVYVNKIYCCSSKSNPSNSVRKSCTSVLSRTTENDTNSLNSNSTEQSVISTITDALLPENEAPSLQTVSYEPVAISSELLENSNSSQVMDSSVNNMLRGKKVNVTMKVNKYIFSNTSNEIAGSDFNSDKQNVENENVNDSQMASDCERYSIEDFTMSDMEDPEKSKIYFHLANTKILCLEEEIIRLRKLK